ARPGHRSGSPHDVDLCLVSPCEFEHPKSERSPPGTASPRELSDGDPSQELDCPSLLADGLESDEDSEQPTRGVPRARDPLPAPMKDPCPVPAQPGICMVDPEALPTGKKDPTGKAKRTPSRVGTA
ncbi:MAP1S protein, partial [Semnornis frantzii]|nr:MAP1S protein [Semnornis frantzii]